MVFDRRAAATLAIRAARSAALAGGVLVLAACSGSHGSPAPSVAGTSPALATATPPASGPASPSASATGAARKVQFPRQLIGLQKDTSAEAQQAISHLSKQFAPLSVFLANQHSALYGEAAGNDPFFLVTAGSLAANQVASVVAQGLQVLWSAQGEADVGTFPEGPGTQVVCGQLGNKDVACAWVDSSSATFGYVLYPPGLATSVAVAASDTGKIRAGVVD